MVRRTLSIASLLIIMSGCEAVQSALDPNFFDACCLKISPNPALEGETVTFTWEIESKGKRTVRWTVTIEGDVVDTGSRGLSESDKWSEDESISAREVIDEWGEGQHTVKVRVFDENDETADELIGTFTVNRS